MAKTFFSDTTAPAFPEVLEALARVNHGEVASYGDDPYSSRTQKLFQELFDAPVEVRWACGGTGANMVAMAAVVDRHESILCSDVAHMETHECGAIPQVTGSQLRTIPSTFGKIGPEGLRPQLEVAADIHASLPKVLSLTQATEFGTVYTIDEMATLVEEAHAYGLLVHVDGARIANAIAALHTTLAESLTRVGVDLMSFGGIKGGTMFGEAVVFINPALVDNVRRKHIASGQLPAKARFIAAQFEAFLSNDLWLRGARQANQMAQLLGRRLAEVDGIEISLPVDVNMVWADVSPEVEARVGGQVYTESGKARWVTAWDTTEADIDVVVDVAAGR